MKRISFQNVHIDLLMQNEENIFEQKCLHGVMSTTPKGFKFEQAVKQSATPRRNPKLFDGRYCSLVHMQSGRYQVHMRTIFPVNQEEAQQLAFQVYDELVTAFKQIH